ncbi:MAG: dUTP diphosphatase [Patescibacteria group bacterium]|nr:dUTP diphosphatase [Patescibacteria group bacterium]MCL5094181.1 dUTP diphosphatase [Patescibacteria group bacterium]
MQVKIKRIDKNLPLPIYETNGSVGFDFLAREDTVIKPKEIKLIPGNLIIETPEGYMLMVASRSSTPRKKGLSLPHGVGIIDIDYCGEEDEVLIQVFNFTDEEVKISRGEKIAQGVFVRVDKAQWLEVDKMKDESRGGFGGTDKKEVFHA